MPRATTLEEFDQTIAEIYESAIDPSRWDVALAGIINRSAPPRWDVAMLLWESIAPPGGRFVGAIGVNEFARAGYLQEFAGRNPWSLQGHGLPVGTLVHTDELIARRDFRDTALFRRLLSTWNIDMALIGAVDRAGPERLGLVIPGPDTGSLDQLAAAVKRYLPHLQRATRISRRIGEANLRAANAEAVLHSSPGAIMILGADMDLQFTNAAGEALVAQGIADFREGKIRLRDPAAHMALAGLAMGTDAAPSLALVVERDGHPPMRILAMRIDSPVAQTLTGPIVGGSVLLVATVHSDEVQQELIDRYADWFGLTPTEARLAAMLAKGASLEDFAVSRGVTINAARFLLKGVFAKTGASRQGELVALLRDAPEGWIERREVAE
jgi:DNA-binding CsgD family transcriptional regulator